MANKKLDVEEYDNKIKEESLSQILQKRERILDIMYKALRGQQLKLADLASKYDVSKRSIARDIKEINELFEEDYENYRNTRLVYYRNENAYRLSCDEFLSSKELVAILEILIGSRALSNAELVGIIDKLQAFTSRDDDALVKKILLKELFKYDPVGSDCKSTVENLWELSRDIHNQKEITIEYIRMDRQSVTRRVRPVSVMFSDYYFYLFAFEINHPKDIRYFRVDRITHIQRHKETFSTETHKFDEGELRQRIQFMFPGETKKIRFEFTGPSTQAILDKIPTAKLVGKSQGVDIIEADVIYGRGFLMYMLSQGSWVKAIYPQVFVDDMKEEIKKMRENY